MIAGPFFSSFTANSTSRSTVVESRSISRVNRRAMHSVTSGMRDTLASANARAGSRGTAGSIPYHTINGNIRSFAKSDFATSASATCQRLSSGRRCSDDAMCSRTSPDDKFTIPDFDCELPSSMPRSVSVSFSLELRSIAIPSAAAWICSSAANPFGFTPLMPRA